MKGLDEIFATVRSHLLTQGVVSEDDGGSCRLRGHRGCRCAIGALIRDERYSYALEGLGIGYYKAGLDGPLLQALTMSGVDAYEPRVAALLHDLEDVHDAGQVTHWQAQLDEIARRHASVAPVRLTNSRAANGRSPGKTTAYYARISACRVRSQSASVARMRRPMQNNRGDLKWTIP